MENNFTVSIPKELKTIKSRLLFGLTKRQLIGFSLAMMASIPIFFWIKKISLDAAMYCGLIVAFPFIFSTIYKKDNMVAETWIRLYLENKLLNTKKRRYKITKKNREVAEIRGFCNASEKQHDSLHKEFCE